MLADTPEAEDFQEWLAAIAGSVSRSGPTTPLDLSTTPTEILELVSGLGKAVHEAAQQALATRSEAEEQRPAAHAWRVLASTDGDYSVREAAYILNRDPAISTGQRRLFAFVRASGMVSADTDIPRTRHERHLRLRPTSYAHPHTGRRVPGKPQLRVTVEGLRYLHRRLGGTARLDLPEAEDIRTAQTMPPLARTT
ncbi:phage antirepressor KilAC domain-containing protein [Thermobifida halotolerans]|uniref:Phage antirepressor KilAC domain-containing protein n=2 Tax=Thermobifida halotolerans TaxID=483545 RepID=A0AA97M681_9ACTN|nr:phage antirepressor KilAC domain-containing protein [Thermobifida halotolerans]